MSRPSTSHFPASARRGPPYQARRVTRLGCPNGPPRLYGRGEVIKHVRYALDRGRGRRPDGPYADARDFGNAGGGIDRRAGGARLGTFGQGCRGARGAAGKWRETVGRFVDAVGQRRRRPWFYRPG